MKKIQKVLKEQKGFTLVELVVVIAILGILIAIGVPKYNDITKSSKIKANQATARTIMSAIIMAEAEKPGDDILVSDVQKFLTESTEVEIGSGEANAWTINKEDGEWTICYDEVQYYPILDDYTGMDIK